MPALFQDDGDDDLPGPGDLELGDYDVADLTPQGGLIQVYPQEP